ncbi:hypothetical protein [Marinicella sp. W31]|uniref:hypothetical protein n=1 Tax=Marinicella sp. W31 TaxID=3023713 RepID=UPI0037578975
MLKVFRIYCFLFYIVFNCPKTNADHNIDQIIEAEIAKVNSDECFKNSTSGKKCEYKEFSFDKSLVHPKIAENEAILITDFDLSPAVNVLLYQNRIIGFYSFDKDGKIVSSNESIIVPRVLGEVLVSIGSLEKVTDKHAAALLSAINTIYTGHIPYATSHGFLAYSAMSKFTPHQPVVFLDIKNIFFHNAIPSIFCSIRSENDQINLDKLYNQSKIVKEQILYFYKKHNIKFVNASWGIILEHIKSDWKRLCHTAMPEDSTLLALLKTYTPIYDALFNTPGVFTSQASFQGDFNHYKEIPFDIENDKFPNRLRFGVIGQLDHSIPEYGIDTIQPSVEKTPADENLSDLYLNTGCVLFQNYNCRESDTHSLRVPLGLGSINEPALVNQSSFVSPLGLAYFINIRNNVYNCAAIMSNQLISKIKSNLLSSCKNNSFCKFHDPIGNDFFKPSPFCGNRGEILAKKVPSNSFFGTLLLACLIIFVLTFFRNKQLLRTNK